MRRAAAVAPRMEGRGSEVLGLGQPPAVVAEAGRTRQAGKPLTLGPRTWLRWRLAHTPAVGRAFWRPVPLEVAAAFSLGKQVLGTGEDGVCFATVSSWDLEPKLLVRAVPHVGAVAKIGVTARAVTRVDAEQEAVSRLAEAWSLRRSMSGFPAARQVGPGPGFLQEELDRYTGPPGRVLSEVLEALRALCTAAAAPPATSDCPACTDLLRGSHCDTLWHGDATPWNVLCRDRTTCLVDWELALPFVAVPGDLVRGQWEVRRAIAYSLPTRKVRLRQPHQVAALCFDSYRKAALGKNDHWAGRAILARDDAGGHRYV